MGDELLNQGTRVGSRLGLLGGTFDPVHEGHLDLGRHCFTVLALDELRFLPTFRPAHKDGAQASSLHRHAMLSLATAGRADFRSDPRELRREGVTYTIDSLDELRAEEPDAELFFLAGADSLKDLQTWRRWEEILERCVFVAVGRAGLALEDAAKGHEAAIAAGRIRLVEHEPPSYSSRELRKDLARGPAPKGALPVSVAEYIRKHRLYAETEPT
jgi:nicotinate-nucleotide adenylyltransferase